MARYVRLDAVGPFKIMPEQFPRDEQGNLKAMFVCACGLSRKMPFCDGTHKACRTAEREGMVYTYDAGGNVVSERPE